MCSDRSFLKSSTTIALRNVKKSTGSGAKNSRTCVVCKKVDLKAELVRLAFATEHFEPNELPGLIYFDFACSSESRGFYVHNKIQCLQNRKAEEIVKGYVKKVFNVKIKGKSEIVPFFESFEKCVNLGEKILGLKKLNNKQIKVGKLLLAGTKDKLKPLETVEKKEKKKFRL